MNKKSTSRVKPIEIKWLTKSGGLNQIYSSGLEFSFVSESKQQIHQFVLCKDYLIDAISATINNNTVNIYGFEYDPRKMPPVDLNCTRLVMVNAKDPEFTDKTEAVVDFINQFERHLHLDVTEAFVLTNVPQKYKKCGAIYIEGSGRWQMAPPMISLYSLLLRVGFTHKVGDKWETTVENLIKGSVKPYQSNDTNYLTRSKVAIDKIMKLGYRPFFFGDYAKNYPVNIPIHTLHNQGGIVSMASDSSKSVCKHWTRKEIQQRLDGTYVKKEKLQDSNLTEINVD